MWKLGRWFRRSRRRSAGCVACGVCCELYGQDLRAAPEDLDRWRAQGRLDLVLRVGEEGLLWCEPATGKPLADCPFLVRLPSGTARCRIHSTKPAVCRNYPTRAHRHRCVRGFRIEEG